jgi:hypothetical protein
MHPRPRTAYHVCIVQPCLMPCARQMLHLPTIHHSRQQRSIGHSLLCKIRLQSRSPRPEVSRKRMHPNGPDGQSLACIQAYHSEGTNLAKIGSLGRAQSKLHYLLDSSIPVPGIEIERDSEIQSPRERPTLACSSFIPQNRVYPAPCLPIDTLSLLE